MSNSNTFFGKLAEKIIYDVGDVKGAKALRNIRIGIAHVRIPDGVELISPYAFDRCKEKLESVILPNSLTRIEKSTFSGCKKLKSINIPAGVKVIGDNAFEKCSTLTEINIPNSVEVIGPSAFEGCSSLTEINIPNNIKTLHRYTFSGTKIKKVIIPDGVERIETLAFGGCILDEITIPATVKSIPSHALGALFETKIHYRGTAEEWASIKKIDPPYKGQTNNYPKPSLYFRLNHPRLEQDSRYAPVFLSGAEEDWADVGLDSVAAYFGELMDTEMQKVPESIREKKPYLTGLPCYYQMSILTIPPTCELEFNYKE